jgi:hypothetical protein
VVTGEQYCTASERVEHQYGFELDRHLHVVLSLPLKKHSARTLSPYQLIIDPASSSANTSTNGH